MSSNTITFRAVTRFTTEDEVTHMFIVDAQDMEGVTTLLQLQLRHSVLSFLEKNDLSIISTFVLPCYLTTTRKGASAIGFGLEFRPEDLGV